MNKKFSSLFVIAFFLYMQFFSILHMAEHGFEEHDHNGQNCEIYIHTEESKKLLASDSKKIDFPFYYNSYNQYLVPKTQYTNKTQLFYSRAPPIISVS